MLLPLLLIARSCELATDGNIKYTTLFQNISICVCPLFFVFAASSVFRRSLWASCPAVRSRCVARSSRSSAVRFRGVTGTSVSKKPRPRVVWASVARAFLGAAVIDISMFSVGGIFPCYCGCCIFVATASRTTESSRTQRWCAGEKLTGVGRLLHAVRG